MTRFISRYSLRYIRSLVYMMQASEYHTLDFFLWYERVKDFRTVEKRKTIVWSAKATYLFGLLWVVAILEVAFAIYVFSIFSFPYNVLASLGSVWFGSFIPPYALALLSLLGLIVQKPIELLASRRTAKKLAAHKGFKIAIAGSYGKTTMREILRATLAAGKKVAAPPGSYNTPLGIARFVDKLKGDEEVLIFELGEYYPGDVKKLCEIIHPQLGVITGVNEAHLEKFKTLERTADTIFELAAYVAPDSLYINGESKTAALRAQSGNMLYSREGTGRFTIQAARTGLDGTSLTLAGTDHRFEVHSPLLGLHQAGPISAAADIAARLGLSREAIATGIAGTKPFSHRLEMRTDQSGVVTLDDSYNGNPDGAAAVIDFLSALSGHRRFYVTPGLVEMGDRKEIVHRTIGKELAAGNIEKVVLMRNSVTPYIERGLQDAQYAGEILWYDDMPQALAALAHVTVSGDVVLIQNDWPDQYA